MNMEKSYFFNFHMGKKLLFLLVILFVVGCQAQEKITEQAEQASVPAAPQEAKNENSIDMPSEIIKESATSENKAESRQPELIPLAKQFQVYSDDNKFDPSTITVQKGDKVKITFNFNEDKIYYGGLDIRSDYFDIDYRKGDEKSKTAEFTAEESFTFTSYWPATGVKKAAGTIEVK